MADGEVRIDITGDASELLKELEQLKSRLSDTQAQEEQLGKGTSSFGNVAKAAGKAAAAAFVTVGTAVSGAATAAVAVGMDFESAMSNVAAVSGATGDELQMLSDTAKEMGATTQFSATQAAEALSYMALAGWDAQQSADALPGILDLAAASGMELASASDMVTDYLSAFGMSCEDSTYFADMLAYAQGNANTTAELLGESYKNCAANMAAAGQDIETTTSLLSMMANQGLKGSEAGTALAAVMRDLTAKMSDGAIKISDTSVAVQDASGNYRDLTDILKDIESATNSMGDAEKAAALSSTFTSDSIKGLNLILNAGVDSAAGFEEQLRKSAGTAENMAKTMNDNLKGRITELGSALEGVGIQAYEAMEGDLKAGVESAIESVGELSEQMSDGRLKDSTERLASAFGKIIDSAGKLAKTSLPKVINGFATLVDNADKATAAVAATGAGLAAWKAATSITSKFSEAVTILTAAEKANAVALTAVNGGFTASQVTVGVLTGKISLLTAAQSALNAVCALNPYAVMATAVAAAAVGIGILIATHKDETLAYKEVCDSIYEEADAFEKLQKAKKNAADAGMAEVDQAEALIYQYKQLADSTGTVRAGTDEYARAKALANQINAVTPGAIQDLEDENGAYLRIADSIDLVIAKKRASALADANQDAYDTAVKNAERAVQRLIELDQQRINKQNELKQAQQDYADWDSDYNANRVNQAQNALNEIAAAYAEQKQTVSDYYQTINEQTTLWAALESDNIEDVKAAIDGYENKIVEFTGENAAECQKRAIDAQAYYDKLKELQRTGIEIDAGTLESARSTAEQQKQIARDAAAAQAQAVDERRTQVTEAFGTTNAAIIAKLQELYPALKSSGELTAFAYAQGIQGNLTESTNAGRAMALAAKVAALLETSGTEEVGKNFVDGLLNGMIEESGLPEDQARAVMQACIDAAKDTAETHSPSRVMMEIGQNLDEGLANGMSENQDLVTETATALAQTAINAVQTGLGNLSRVGSNFVALFSGGISSGSGTAKSAASSMASSAAFAAGAQRGLFSASGTGGVTAFTAAIKSGKSSSDTAARSIAQSSAQTMDAQKAQYNRAGTSVATQFKTGINNMKNQTASTARSIAAAGHAAAAQTKSQWSSVGSNLASGLASGISHGASSVISAAVNIARNAISAAKATLGIHSPSRVADKEIGQQYAAGIAQGVDRRANDVRESVVELLDTRKLTLDTVINSDSSGIGERLLSAVQARIAAVSDALLNNTSSRSVISNTERQVYITYAPVQKIDEPISLAQRESMNRRDARRIARLVTNA